MVLDPYVSPEEIRSRELELVSKGLTSFASVVTQQQCYGHCPRDCSAQQLKQQLRSTLVAAQWRGDITFKKKKKNLAAVHCLLGLPGRSARSSVFLPRPLHHHHITVPVRNKPPRFCGRKGKCVLLV